jgi:hypothetical protein
MTPQQKALIAELRAADYPATWKLSASAADDKLVASGSDGLGPGPVARPSPTTWLWICCS